MTDATNIPLPLWPDSPLFQDDGKPVFSVFLPTSSARSSKAVIVCPGGGYTHLADHEGDCFAEWFASQGHVAFVLRYRVAPHRFPVPQIDVGRAVRVVRQRAGEWGVDPGAVGLMGFSAGGHLVSTVATQPELCDSPEDDLKDTISARPDFLILGYPVISFLPPDAHEGSVSNLLGPDLSDEMRKRLSGHLQVTAETPRTFLFHTAADQAVPVENSLAFAAACRASGVPVELHIFPNGRHGLGLAKDDPHLCIWTQLLLNWMNSF